MALRGKKKTRFHSRWRVDQDYVQKLSPAERAWLDRFNDEYYRAEFAEKPLHPEVRRGEIFSAQNAAERDLVTAPTTKVTAATTSPVTRPCLRVRFYQAEDYRMLSKPLDQKALEDDLVALMEDASKPCDLVSLFARRLRPAS